jgi:hypothetical protein
LKVKVSSWSSRVPGLATIMAFFILKTGNNIMKNGSHMMNNVLCSILVLVTCLALLAATPDEKAPKPQYDEKGQLIRPADRREWIFRSAEYGMNHSPAPGRHEMFPNVSVRRWAYNELANSEKWPEKCMFMIDERDSAIRSSVSRKG